MCAAVLVAMATDGDKIKKALAIAAQWGGNDDHHGQWVIDQMVRALTGCPAVMATAIDCKGHKYTYETQGESAEYRKFIASAGEWDEGIAP